MSVPRVTRSPCSLMLERLGEPSSVAPRLDGSSSRSVVPKLLTTGFATSRTDGVAPMNAGTKLSPAPPSSEP